MKTARRTLEQQYGDRAAQAFVSDKGDDPVHAWMASRLPADLADKTVLDIGCGAGRWFGSFEQRGARRSVGIDASRAMLAQIHGHEIVGAYALADAPRLWDRRIILVHGSMQEILPALPSPADLAFASYSLCVMDDPQAALGAIHAALGPGGQALICTNVLVHE
jgi:SAM-dependent methyltransferase